MHLQNSASTPYSVAELLGDIKPLLEGEFPEVWVEGEVSGVVRPASGHCYFSLKDADSVIRCVLFRNRMRRVLPQDGMHVLLCGKVTLFARNGQMQMQIAHLEDAGEGKLRRQFEALKRKLNAEGLFDARHKQQLPAYPQVIGVISSDRGAALQDILVTLHRRYPVARAVVYPTLVQGAGAVDGVVEMLRVANERRDAEVLIVARGGGSLEDLQAFNDEKVARAIFASKLPVISAIGHEIDFTIADMAADLRAPTPTAAAEKVAPECAQMLQQLRRVNDDLQDAMRQFIDNAAQKLDYAAARLVHPAHRLQIAQQKRRALTDSLTHLAWRYLDECRLQVQRLAGDLRLHSPQVRMQQHLQTCEALHRRLLAAAHAVDKTRATRVQHLTAQLQLVNPRNVLQRGYAIVQDEDDAVVHDATAIRPGQRLQTSVARGRFWSVVE